MARDEPSTENAAFAPESALQSAHIAELIDQTGLGVVECDKAGRVLAVNGCFTRLVGSSDGDLVGQPLTSLVQEEDRRSLTDMIDQLWHTEIPQKVDVGLLGTVARARFRASLVRTPGAPSSIVMLCRDISRRPAIGNLSAAHATVRGGIAEGVILGTWVWDGEVDRLSGDSRFARLLALDPQDLASGLPAQVALAAVHPDDLESLLEALRNARLSSGFFHAEFRLRQPDGGWLWVEANGQSEVGASGARLDGILINIDQRRDAVERQAFLIELGDQIRVLDDPDTVMARVAEATGRHLRAHRVGYAEVSADGRSLHVRAAWAREGQPALGTFPVAMLGTEAAEKLQAGHAVSRNLSLSGQSSAILSVPLLREGRWHAVMFVSDDSSRLWTESEASLLREAVGRTWEAVERARAVVTLRKAQARQAFLLRLNDHLSEIHEPGEVLETVAEGLAGFLRAERVGYAEADLNAKAFTIERTWLDGQMVPEGALLVFEGQGEADVAELARGLTLTVDDLAAESNRSDLVEVLAQQGTGSILVVPLIRDGRLRSILYLSQAKPRHWTLEEVSLTQEVARRTWDALERTRAEQALQRSEARLRAMFDTLPVGIVFAEMPSGQVTEGNARVEQILGSQLLPNTEGDIGEWVAFDEAGQRVGVEDHPLYLAVTTGDPATRVFHHQRADGSRVWVSVIGAPVRNAEQQITGGLVTIVDIDREKRAVDALRELNATLETQIEQRTRERDRAWRNSQDLLVVMSADGVMHAVNPSWTALLGWPMDALAGLRFETVMHPDDIAPTFTALAELRQGPLPMPFENRFRTADGQVKWFSWTASLESDVVYATGRDVTAVKAQTEALRQAEEQLRQSQKMEAVGQLTGGIAHDFNNLLTGITGALDLLGKRIRQGRTDNVERYVEMAVSSANRAASLTHRLLAFSRRQPLEAKPVDANAMMVSIEDLLRRSLSERITLDIVKGDELWLTLCDPHQLENAVLNLVINARDAMPDGGTLTVSTKNAAIEDIVLAREVGIRPGRYVTITVSDTGTGMTEDVIARAFDPFFTTKPIGQGTGLGLSMIYGFAKQSEGTVKIDSVIGHGTAVTLYLPRFGGTLRDVPQQRGETVPTGAGETVLVVEDDATVRTLALEVLRDLGYQALEAHDGPSGLRIIDSDHRIDLLVTDVGLPGLNGRQLADRATKIRPGLKVLFITGYAENAAFGTGVTAEGMQMITKPFAIETLVSKIKEMINSP